MLFGLFAQLYFLNIIRSFNGIILLDSIDMINDILLSRVQILLQGIPNFPPRTLTMKMARQVP